MAKDKNFALDTIMENLLPYIAANINGVQVAKVVSIDGNEADCQPLALQSDGDKRAMYIACKVAKNAMFYPTSTDGTKLSKLAPGNIVVVIFADRDMDNFDGGEFSLASRRMHSVNDGIVTEVLA